MRAQERTGRCTPARGGRVGERLICGYDSGRAHAGENLAAWLEPRESDLEPPLAMSDAGSRHEVEAGWVMRGHCLAHGRRQCSDLEAVFPSECRVVIDALKQVVDHDEEARDQRRSAEARLAYHPASSQPLRDALTVWLDQQLADRLVEPHRSWGQAIPSMPNDWQPRTRFVSIPGAPLDNHLVERALKWFIRQCKTARFYRREPSA